MLEHTNGRCVDLDHKAKVAWVKNGKTIVASFAFEEWGGANKAAMAAHAYSVRRIETDEEKINRYRYVLDGVLSAIKTGRNEQLQIWKEQIEIALDDA